MGQDEKIREAQEILNWAIMHLNGSITNQAIIVWTPRLIPSAVRAELVEA